MNIEKIVKKLGELKDKKIIIDIITKIGENAFSIVDKNDEKYLDGKQALDKCMSWSQEKNVSADELYELIDNPECTGISEFIDEENDSKTASLWCLLVDIVSYTAWIAYRKEKTKYLPQALEGIREEDFSYIINDVIENELISDTEVMKIIYDKIMDKEKNGFISKNNIEANNSLI